MRQVKIGEIVLDFSFYPRTAVDMTHVGYMKEAIAAGAVMPPLVICQKSMRAVDGFHRCRAYTALYGPEHLVDVVEKRYRTDAEMLADSIRLNANHGRTLTRHDRVHCILLAEKLELTLDEVAGAMSMTMEALTELRAGRVATSIGPRRRMEPLSLKQTIRHMAGKTLTAEQVTVNKKLSGMNQVFYVNQLVALIESGLLDRENSALMTRLSHLGDLIRKLNKSAA